MRVSSQMPRFALPAGLEEDIPSRSSKTTGVRDADVVPAYRFFNGYTETFRLESEKHDERTQ